MKPNSRTKLTWLAGLLVSCSIWQIGVAQQSPISDEQHRSLEVRRRQFELRAARTPLPWPVLDEIADSMAQ